MNLRSILFLALAGCGGAPFEAGPLFAVVDDGGTETSRQDGGPDGGQDGGQDGGSEAGDPPVEAEASPGIDSSPSEAAPSDAACTASQSSLGYPDPAYCSSGAQVPAYFNIYRPACQGGACAVCIPETPTPPACQCAGAYTCACLLDAGITCPDAGAPSGCDAVGAELTLNCPAPGG